MTARRSRHTTKGRDEPSEAPMTPMPPMRLCLYAPRFACLRGARFPRAGASGIGVIGVIGAARREARSARVAGRADSGGLRDDEAPEGGRSRLCEPRPFRRTLGRDTRGSLG